MIYWTTKPYISGSNYLMKMGTMDGGDHTIFLCDVTAHKNVAEGEVLTLDTLRKHKMIRI